jgi:hypothetical protein
VRELPTNSLLALHAISPGLQRILRFSQLNLNAFLLLLLLQKFVFHRAVFGALLTKNYLLHSIFNSKVFSV